MKEQTCVYRAMAQGSWSETQFKNPNSEKFLRLYQNDSKMMEAFNQLTEYKYKESFEKYAATSTYNQLLYAHAFHLMKPYYKLRKKYGIHTGKGERLLIFNHPHLAKLLEYIYKLRNFFIS